jgi:hypothetical protein
MKLPLRWGLAALLGLWVLHGFLEAPNARTLLLVVAMGVALWTAFSLNIPARTGTREEEPMIPPPEERKEMDPPSQTDRHVTEQNPEHAKEPVSRSHHQEED